MPLKAIVAVITSGVLAYGAWFAIKVYETMHLIKSIVKPIDDKPDEFCPVHLTDINCKES